MVGWDRSGVLFSSFQESYVGVQIMQKVMIRCDKVDAMSELPVSLHLGRWLHIRKLRIIFQGRRRRVPAVPALVHRVEKRRFRPCSTLNGWNDAAIQGFHLVVLPALALLPWWTSREQMLDSAVPKTVVRSMSANLRSQCRVGVFVRL